MKSAVARRKLTPPEVAKLWGITPDKVIAWIRSGELRAIDASSRPGLCRPRFRIDPDDLADFERRRSVSPPPKAPRKQRATGDVMTLLGES